MKKKFISIIVFALLAACAPVNSASFVDETTPSPSLSPAVSAILPPTKTPPETLAVSPTITPKIEASNTPTPYLSVCIQLDEINQIEAKGVFLVRLPEDNVPILINPNGTRIKAISNYYFLGHAVSSPDRTKFAYIQDSPRELVIVSINGIELKRYPIPENWVWPVSWVSEDRIFFEKRLYFGESRLEPGILIVYDLETSLFEEIQPNFPDIPPWADHEYWFGNLLFLPDPSLKYTIYELLEGGINLWNMESQAEILRLYNNYRSSSAPVWNRDGDWFIASAPVTFVDDGVRYTNVESELPYITDAFDLFLVTTQGEIRRLTYFSTQYDSLQKSISLSPDGKKLVFWVDTEIGDGDYNWQLAVLDIPSGDVRTYCISAGNLQDPIAPIWSPGGDRLMVTLYEPDNYMSSEIFLIDLLSNEIFTYPENAFGEMWLSQVENNKTNEP